MPKEKTATRKAAAKSKSDGGKKKKGKSAASLCWRPTSMLTCLADPNMPKRGLSAYMFFANEQRDKVRDENPGIKFGMLCFLSRSFWRLLTHCRRGRQASGREVEATQRQAEGSLRGQGCRRQEAVWGGEGCLHCGTFCLLTNDLQWPCLTKLQGADEDEDEE
jgi:hypothetical protein